MSAASKTKRPGEHGADRKAPTFAELAVVEERKVHQGQRTWRIAICRQHATGDLVVIFSNRDKVYGGSRVEHYRGRDPEAARAVAQPILDRAHGRGYLQSDGSPARPFGWAPVGRPARRSALEEVMRRSRSAAA